MKRYDTFVFDSYRIDPGAGKIELHYALDEDIRFTETLALPRGLEHGASPEKHAENLDAALFALHLIGGISYYKTFCPRNIVVRSGTLSKEQAAFWNIVYENGLGQFFYENSVDFRGLIRFPFRERQKTTTEKSHPRMSKRINESTKKRVFVPLGGGKDSVVTLELIKRAGYDVTLFRMNAHPLIAEIANTANLPLLTVERRLSPALFTLNTQGALNGHVPITAYLSFLTIVVALLGDFDTIAMSNERSASEGNVEFSGMEVNHQWSKSLACEKLLQEYICTNISPGVAYFSLLRPLSELSITQRFSHMPEYFSVTTSCNQNWKIAAARERKNGLWCRECPKCAFVFLLYVAFLPKKTLVNIFGKNLFEDMSLLPLYRQLLGLEGYKPFECIGTAEEAKAAFLLAHGRGECEGTPVMEMFLGESLPKIKSSKLLIDSALTASEDHCIPLPFQNILRTR